ncbi:hypothetical protein ACVBIL_09845 [Shewanella sp. 125m-7]
MKQKPMQINSLLKVTLVFTLCVILHRCAYTLLVTSKSLIAGGALNAD